MSTHLHYHHLKIQLISHCIRDESIMLFFLPIMLLSNSQEMYQLIMLKRVTVMPVYHWRRRAGDLYTLLGFDSLQFSVNCPTAPALPARRVSWNLTLLRAKSEGLGKPAQ